MKNNNTTKLKRLIRKLARETKRRRIEWSRCAQDDYISYIPDADESDDVSYFKGTTDSGYIIHYIVHNDSSHNSSMYMEFIDAPPVFPALAFSTLDRRSTALIHESRKLYDAVNDSVNDSPLSLSMHKHIDAIMNDSVAHGSCM